MKTESRANLFLAVAIGGFLMMVIQVFVLSAIGEVSSITSMVILTVGVTFVATGTVAATMFGRAKPTERTEVDDGGEYLGFTRDGDESVCPCCPGGGEYALAPVGMIFVVGGIMLFFLNIVQILIPVVAIGVGILFVALGIWTTWDKPYWEYVEEGGTYAKCGVVILVIMILGFLFVTM